MEMPTKRQIDEAIVDSKLAGETEAELNERIDAMCRLTDEDLARLGIHPNPTQPEPEPEPQPEPASPLDFEPVRRKVRHDGWTAERQRTFIQCLAETGCVRTACAEVGIAARSAYRLREHGKAASFRSAWDHATSLATARLAAIAFDRAINGSVERIYRNGELYEERRKPSDRLLMWLLSHHNPVNYGWLSKPPKEGADQSYYLTNAAQKELPALLGKLADVPLDDCPVDVVSLSDLDSSGDPEDDC